MLVSNDAAEREAAALVDAAANRQARKYPWREQWLRVSWGIGQYAFKLSPRPFFAWRRWVLRIFGAVVGRQVHVYPSTRIYMPWNVEIGDWAAIGEDAFIYSLGRVRIGARAAISYRAHVCAGTHDFADSALPLLKPPVSIGENAWIGTDAFIGPGVCIGQGAIVGARAVVVNDVAPLQIVAGNPAKQIGVRRLHDQASNEPRAKP
jgi:putative colanic acid biosynthesis acetyltransferase WcaF